MNMHVKLIVYNDSELETQVNIVKEFIKDIQMEFGFGKCAEISIKKGKILKNRTYGLMEK